MSEWISVDDRLPEKGQECIVYGGETGVMVDTFEDRHADNGWFIELQSWCGRNEEHKVAFWMPLPDPPEV